MDSRVYPSSRNKGPEPRSQGIRRRQKARPISMIASILLAAAGYSLLYLLLGGGLGGAILIFIVAKMLGQ